jgi:hypothetical protein
VNHAVLDDHLGDVESHLPELGRVTAAELDGLIVLERLNEDRRVLNDASAEAASVSLRLLHGFTDPRISIRPSTRRAHIVACVACSANIPQSVQ